jgi:MraZ protein
MEKLGPLTAAPPEEPKRPARASFYGTSHHKVSGRNQVSLPKSFLRAYEGSDEGHLFLMRWKSEGFLRIYTQKQLDLRIDEIRANDTFDNKQKEELIRKVAGGAEQIDPDRQGRFVLPAKWVEALGLREEVVFTGAQTRIEIWPAPAHEDRQEKEDEATVAATEEVTTILNL